MSPLTSCKRGDRGCQRNWHDRSLQNLTTRRVFVALTSTDQGKPSHTTQRETLASTQFLTEPASNLTEFVGTNLQFGDAGRLIRILGNNGTVTPTLVLYVVELCMAMIPLTAISQSLNATYGCFVGDGSAHALITGETGPHSLTCSRCGNVVGTAMHGLPNFINASCRCHCGAFLHLTKPYRYSSKIPMLNDLGDPNPPQFGFDVAVLPNTPVSDRLKSISEDQGIRLSILQGTPPRSLFHYTSQQGLLGIISGGAIWASDLGYLNDSSELSYGESLISDEMRRLEQQSDDPRIREWLRRAQKLTLPSDVAQAFFAACFCGNGDLLSQWRAYGENGRGYAIGFDSHHLQVGALKLRRVIYERSEQISLVNALVSELTLVFTEVFQGESLDQLDAEGRLPAFSAYLSSLLTELSLTFKHPSFAEEAEWRLILPFHRHNMINQIDLRASGNMLVPYAKLAFSDGKAAPPLPILEICIGPSPQPELKLKAALLLLERSGYDHVEVRGSNTPLRV